MRFILIGMAIAVLGALPLEFPRRGWLSKSAIMFIIGAIFWSFIAWLSTPQLIGPFFGAGAIWMTIFAVAINAIVSGVMVFIDRDSRGHSDGYLLPSIIAALVVTVLPVLSAISGSAFFHAKDYRNFVERDVEQREWVSDMSVIDTAHIRMVSQEQAEWRANKVLGQADGSLGSRYKVGILSIQKVGEELVWVAPLEFQDFKSWQSFGHTPGYVKVSAEDPHREAELVTGYELAYMPTAYWSKNLERYLHCNGYQFKGTTDYTFEIDDEGKPSFVITVFKPTIAYWGEEITGVLVVDPVSGELAEYSIDEAPEWIDRIYPEWFACQRLTDYGRYVLTWWNAVWRKDQVNVPTSIGGSRDLWLIWGDDGRAYWFTGLTSEKDTDQSLVGFVLMDTRTGHTKTYRISGDDESGIVATVNSAVSNFSGWHATQPILYNVYGELTWVVPVVSKEGIFQRIAFVHTSTQKVALGQTKREGLAEYRSILAENGNRSAPSSESSHSQARGNIARITSAVENGDTTFYIVLDGSSSGVIFTGGVTVSPELAIAREGDPVVISYMETGETLVPLDSFDLVSFISRMTTIESVTEERHEVEDAKVDDRHEARDIRGAIINMSDDELLRQYGNGQ